VREDNRDSIVENNDEDDEDVGGAGNAIEKIKIRTSN
jgi:hypothetical protein